MRHGTERWGRAAGPSMSERRRLPAHSSQPPAHSPQFTAHGSQPTAPSSQHSPQHPPHGSQPTAPSSQPTTPGSWRRFLTHLAVQSAGDKRATDRAHRVLFRVSASNMMSCCVRSAYITGSENGEVDAARTSRTCWGQWKTGKGGEVLKNHGRDTLLRVTSAGDQRKQEKRDMS